ncbi:translin-associated factor X-interacting protein 1-like isoform X3 [Falco rusticolus]|uniref:translin-associated factor X-interacting protein 1-like isoform X3 n=1 Tax=Falco rusticolus TaxID=120794 RepID=UPI00188658DC|nr:translin-associated factor X-interacting protein 1-like isoform X3 [Falco rusticolus]XP_037242395.1 translin-associated factor X-interacting protein 1-like isoform X3 [Falco rusticolus]XP_037242396.1 translin-associated factor X-interacting protein 1-like isoform X3 [Falco rusticolus]
MQPASASWCFGTELRLQASIFCLRKGIARKCADVGGGKVAGEQEEEGSAAAFVAKPRSQDVREKQEYLSQLKNKLGDLLEGKADDLKTAFCATDPGIDDQTLDTYVGLPDQEDVPVETALERLLAGYARRVGPSPREGSATGFGGEEGDFQ